MAAPWGLIFRVFAFVAFGIAAILFATGIADLVKWAWVLIAGGLAVWVFAEIVGPAGHRTA